jgi:hypothetical protein
MKEASARPEFVVALTIRRLRELAIRTFDSLMARATLHKDYSSSRPCPECGGPMTYNPMRWSALTGRYLRVCQSCDYTDPRPVKMVRQI